MIAIPLSIAILVIGILMIQHNHYRFLELQKNQNKAIVGLGELEKFKKDLEEYKKRVDALTLRAGFKL